MVYAQFLTLSGVMSTSWSDIFIPNRAPPEFEPRKFVELLDTPTTVPGSFGSTLPGRRSAVQPFYGHGQAPGLLPSIGVAFPGHL